MAYNYILLHVNMTTRTIKPLTRSRHYINTIKKYKEARDLGQHHPDEEAVRAPSTAEEFKRVAEQKLRQAEHSDSGDRVEGSASSKPEAHDQKRRIDDHKDGGDHDSR